METLTVMFTDIEGSTELATVMGDAAAREIGRVHDSVVRSQLAGRGGQEVKSTGDGLLVRFTSARDAIACAAGIQHQIERHNQATPHRAVNVRIGIHTGEVATENGDLFGEAVNAAARIAAKARGGETLLSDVSRRLVRHAPGCSFRERGWHRLRGFPERWHLFELVREAQSLSLPRTPFVPREELSILVQTLQRAAMGEGAVVLVTGEAGVGKSRLCEEAIAASGLVPVRGAATEKGTTPYGPVALALREHRHHYPDACSEGPLGPYLGAILPELGEPPADGDREKLAAAVAAVLESGCKQQPTALVLDDLQWADSATLEVVYALAGLVRNWPLAVLCVYRADEIPRGHPVRRLRNDLRRSNGLNELVVGPLDPGASVRLAEHVLGQRLGPVLRAAIHDRTQGVPFFVEELASAVRSSDLVMPAGSCLELAAGARIPVPTTVRDAVRLRLEALSDEAISSLEAAATIGSPLALEVLAAMGEDVGVDEAIDAGVLQETAPGTCVFRHALVREAVYADTTWSRRRALHRSLAELFESSGGEPRLIADHWLAAGERGRARPLMIESARRSARVYAARDAASAIRIALEHWAEGEAERQRYDALIELGRCSRACGDLSEAARAWEEAAEILDPSQDAAALARLGRDLATVYDLSGRLDRAVAARLEAGEMFERAELGAEAAAVRLLAVHHLFSSDPPKATSLTRQALEAARSAGRRDLEARALSLQGLLLGLGGDLEGGQVAVRRGLSLALAHQHIDEAVSAHWVLGTLANHWADYERAESSFDAAIELCRTNGRPGEQLCLSCMAIVAYNRGDWTRADEIARQVLDTPARPEVRAHALLVRGLLSLARGATKRARSLLDRALAASEDPASSSTSFQARAGLALADELDGQGGRQWEAILTTSPTELRQNFGWWLCRAATAAARRGDQPLIRQCADVLATWSSRFAGVEGLAALAHVLGEVALAEGQPAQAADHLGRALEVMAGIDAPFEMAHTQGRAGLALARAGDTEAGVTLMIDAYRTFRRLRARPFWIQAAADLDSVGVQVDRRLGRRAADELDHGGLTRRELEILRRVAVGSTNREIATDLFVSTRTVDMHVRNLLSKLGCRTRTEAVARAHELELLTPAH